MTPTIERYDEQENYSSGVCVDNLIFTAGHLGASAGDEPSSFEAQLELALERLIATVTAMGGARDTIIKVNGYISDVAYFPVYHATYRKLLRGVSLPARTTVQVGGFEAPILVELDAIAAVAADDDSRA